IPNGSTDAGDLLGNQFIHLFENGNPTSNYTINGGRWILKPFQGISGPVGSLFYFSSVPIAPILELQHLINGSTNLFQSDDSDFFMKVSEDGSGVPTWTAHA